MDLILVRHAIAPESDPVQWPIDSERPLTKRGERRFRQGAVGIAKLVPGVDAVLSSPFRRAWQTALILEETAAWPEPLPCPELEPDRTADEPLSVLQGSPDWTRVALVGHEPYLSRLAAYLLAGADAEPCLVLKKGGAACLRFDSELVPGSACLRWWATPAMLRALGD
jgi:phosphohistidine phosphatase